MARGGDGDVGVVRKVGGFDGTKKRSFTSKASVFSLKWDRRFSGEMRVRRGVVASGKDGGHGPPREI